MSPSTRRPRQRRGRGASREHDRLVPAPARSARTIAGQDIPFRRSRAHSSALPDGRSRYILFCVMFTAENRLRRVRLVRLAGRRERRHSATPVGAGTPVCGASVRCCASLRQRFRVLRHADRLRLRRSSTRWRCFSADRWGFDIMGGGNSSLARCHPHRWQSCFRRERCGPGVSVRDVVDAAQRRLAARRIAAHPLQRDVRCATLAPPQLTSTARARMVIIYIDLVDRRVPPELVRGSVHHIPFFGGVSHTWRIRADLRPAWRAGALRTPRRQQHRRIRGEGLRDRRSSSSA